MNIHCWMCGVRVTEDNASGKRYKTGLTNACKDCSLVYSVMRLIHGMPVEELKDRILKLNHKTDIHEHVLSNHGVKLSELAKGYVNK